MTGDDFETRSVSALKQMLNVFLNFKGIISINVVSLQIMPPSPQHTITMYTYIHKQIYGQCIIVGV